jgi:MarR family transcriptional repressor of emrRAB
MTEHDLNVLGALGLALADRLADAAAPTGSASAAEALVTLHARSGDRSIDAVARVCGLSHSGAVRLADRLEAAGLAERRHGADRRSTALHLTPAGHRAARRVLAERQLALQSVMNLLTDDQQRDLTALAESILIRLAGAGEPDRRLCRLCDLEACGRSRGECPVAGPRGRRPPVRTATKR